MLAMQLCHSIAAHAAQLSPKVKLQMFSDATLKNTNSKYPGKYFVGMLCDCIIPRVTTVLLCHDR